MQITEIFPWNENFTTGIEVIDSQHRNLVDLLNVFTSLHAHDAPNAALSKAFDDLADYAEYHFRTEELIWHKHLGGDAEEQQHLAAHQQFTEKIRQLKNQNYRELSSDLIAETLSFLTHWLAFHILESDMFLAKWVQAAEAGNSREDAKQIALVQMHGAAKILLDAILVMYDTISRRTLQLLTEINRRQKAETQLTLIKDVFDNTLDAICITDANAIVVDVNPTFLRRAERTYESVIGRDLHALKPGFEYRGQSALIWKSVNEHGSWAGEFTSRTTAGKVESEWLTVSSIKNAGGEITNYVLVFSNVAHLIDLQKNLERRASHDALTDLPNRLLLGDRLERAIARSERNRDHVALCFLDLDGFKLVNDRLGHAAGDSLLIEVAARLKKLLRASDTIARLGGDEFVLIIADLKNPNDCTVLLDRILKSIAEPVDCAGQLAQVSATIGVAFFPTTSQDPETLMKRADQAMYECKRDGKGRYCFAKAD